MSDQQGSVRPLLRVISGDATPEEIAAILAVIAARSGPTGSVRSGPAPAGPTRTGASSAHPATRDVSTWYDHAHGRRGIRAVFAPSPDGWRTSFWPR